MLKKLLSNVNFYLVVGLNAVYATDVIKRRIRKIAETEKVYSAKEYVVVRLARGDYNNKDGFETMQYDYKFYKTISKFHD